LYWQRRLGQIRRTGITGGKRRGNEANSLCIFGRIQIDYDPNYAKPKDARVYQQLAGFYQRQGDFDKLIAAINQRAELEPSNPEAHYSIATYYWDEAYRNTRLSEAQKREYTDKGLQAIEKALQLKPDYVEAITYKGLLLRVQAAMEKDAAKQKQLLSDATKLQEQAVALKKKQAQG